MRIGEYQNLIVKRESPYGLYLSDGETDILLPENQCPDDALVGNSLKVFVYTDSEDRMIATRMKPLAVVGEFAMLKVVSITGAGAFFDWGLQKDLFCPFKEQHYELREGESAVVRVYLDTASKRVVCSTRLTKFLYPNDGDLEVGDSVKIIVVHHLPEFISVIIDHQYKGAMFSDEWFGDLSIGSSHRAYVKKIRQDDGGIAISLRPQGYEAVLGERERLIKALRDNGGMLPVSDRSSPEEIHRRFGLSKGAFKKLVGSLYKEGIISLGRGDIRLK